MNQQSLTSETPLPVPGVRKAGVIRFKAVFTEPLARDRQPAVCKIKAPLNVSVFNNGARWFIEIEGIRQLHMGDCNKSEEAMQKAELYFARKLVDWSPAQHEE